MSDHDAPYVTSTRRRFLGQAALLALAGSCMAAGCGSSGSSGSVTTATSSGQVGGTLDYLSWQGYDLPIPIMKSWLKENQITMRKTYISNQNDVQGTLKAGNPGYDISDYLEAYADLYRDLAILA